MTLSPDVILGDLRVGRTRSLLRTLNEVVGLFLFLLKGKGDSQSRERERERERERIMIVVKQ